MSDKKIVGFQRVGTGDWYIFDDGTKLSSGDGERILRFIRTVDNNKRSTHLVEALGYMRSWVRLQVTKAFYNIAGRMNRD